MGGQRHAPTASHPLPLNNLAPNVFLMSAIPSWVWKTSRPLGFDIRTVQSRAGRYNKEETLYKNGTRNDLTSRKPQLQNTKQVIRKLKDGLPQGKATTCCKIFISPGRKKLDFNF
jgi:hypothetical protein